MNVTFLEPTELTSVSNVVSVVCQETTKFGWEGEDGYQVASRASDLAPENIYYIFDTHNQNAFAHWVFENFVYLHFFFDIKQQYPSAKLVLYEKKDYKYLFLENNGIDRSDIVSREDIDFQYQTLHTKPIEERVCKPNLVFFHPYGSLNSSRPTPHHRYAILSYLETIKSRSKEKTIPILYLPRGEKENFAGLDRRYAIQADCKELVKQLGGVIFETDSNTDYWKQIELVRSAKIILCDYGSNLWVNGFFSEDAHILFLNIGWRQEHIYPYYGLLYSLIHNQNKSMTNVFPTRCDDSSKPTIVYHSFEHVRDCILRCLNE
jgi:hypothetical protein